MGLFSGSGQPDFASTVYGEVSFGAMNLRLQKEEGLPGQSRPWNMDITAFKNRAPLLKRGRKEKGEA